MLDRDKFLKLLDNKTILLTGAGGGIGTEAALAFAAMGARVILAELDPAKGKQAQEAVANVYPNNPAVFYEVDLANEAQVRAMATRILAHESVPDVVFNNATITKMGAVDEVDVSFWDRSYAVNLKAPLLLSQLFLPQMKARNSGALVFVSSSGASPYMGAYEVFKTAQVELANTLAMELDGTGVFAYTVGPGLVKTQTAMSAIEIVAKQMGMTTDSFYEMNSTHILGADAAGLGFALSAANAGRYHGQEIGCIQVLMDSGLFESEPVESTAATTSTEKAALFPRILDTFANQYAGWQRMNIFERQWVLRDFKKSMGISTDQAQEELRRVADAVSGGTAVSQKDRGMLDSLRQYWEHQLKLLRGYEKNPIKLEESARIIEGWIDDIVHFLGE
jgi:NAD(P)-dependent dehydrogenase (short-subunit alcohol dehydrogenase family)